MQIIVLGPHRSGTSLVTRLINMMGAYCFGEGTSIGFNEENPKGFWERRDVIEANDAVLGSLEASWDSPFGWDAEAVPEQALDEFRQRFKNIFLELDAHRPWVMKDPRLCLTLPLVKPLLEVPVLVYVSRFPLEAAASLQVRNRFPLYYGLALWEFYSIQALNAGMSLPARIHVSHRQLVTSPGEAAADLFSRLCDVGVAGLRKPGDEEVQAFVDSGLWRQRQAGVLPLDRLTADQRVVLDSLEGRRDVTQPLLVSPVTSSILEAGNQWRRVDALTAERDSLTERIRDLENQRGSLLERIRDLEGRLDALSGRIHDLEKERDRLLHSLRVAEADREKEAEKRRIFLDALLAGLSMEIDESQGEFDRLRKLSMGIGSLRRHNDLLDEDVSQLSNWLAELDAIVTRIENSFGWRMGQGSMAWAGRLLGRSPSRIMEDARAVREQYAAWRKIRT